MSFAFHMILIPILITSISNWSSTHPLRIMPMGNSITFDYHSFEADNPRPIEERVSYRYRLYQLLTEAGFEFDFVGSEDAGINSFQGPEYDDNAGFPAIQT